MSYERIVAIVARWFPAPLPTNLKLDIIMDIMAGWKGPMPRWSRRAVVTLGCRQRAAGVWSICETVEDEG